MQGNWPQPPIYAQDPPIDGRYRLLYSIGVGGLGEVFRAEDISVTPPVPVAFKRLHPDLMMEADALNEIQKEAEISALLDHPNILKIQKMEMRPDIVYTVTELAEGSLATIPKPVPLSQVVEYLGQIASALDYAHSRGQIHRDIKPENILLAKDGRILLADFSLALAAPNKLKAHKTIQAEAIGTPLYASPEQWNDKVSKASDIYALGVTLFYLLSGKYPFEGTADELSEQHQNAPVPTLKRKNHTVYFPDEDLDKALAWAMAKDPEKRPASANELHNRLKKILKEYSRPVRTTPVVTLNAPTIPPKGTPSQIIGRQFAGSIGTAIVLLFIFGFIAAMVSIGSNLNKPKATATPRPTSTPRATATLSPTSTPRATSIPRVSPTALPFNPTFQFGSTNVVLTGHVGTLSGLGWSSDGKLYSAATDGRLLFWTIDFAKAVATGNKTLLNSDAAPTSITFMLMSPDRQRILFSQVGSNQGIFDIATGTYAPAKLPDGEALNWSWDSRRVAIARDATKIEIWQVIANGLPNYSLNKTINLSGGEINDLAFSPDDNLLAITLEDASVLVYDLRNDKEVARLKRHAKAVNAVGFSPDGKYLATNSSVDMVVVWDTSTWQPVKVFNYLVRGNSLAWSPDSQKLAMGDLSGRIYVWKVGSDNPGVLEGHKSRISSLEWSPNSDLLASGSEDYSIRVWKF